MLYEICMEFCSCLSSLMNQNAENVSVILINVFNISFKEDLTISFVLELSLVK